MKARQFFGEIAKMILLAVPRLIKWLFRKLEKK